MLMSRLIERSELVPISGCRIWTGYSTHDGYGRMRVNGRMNTTHRIAYELAYGPIPKGKFVLHRCDVRSCCNPHHLFLGSNKDNMLDMKVKGRQSKGEHRPDAKLNNCLVLEIRKNRLLGMTINAIASMFSVSRSSVHDVVSGKTWRHV